MEIFNFFLISYRKNILTFCGSKIDVIYDPNGDKGKFTFRKFDNGEFKNKPIVTRHPNIVEGVIIGKKSWGLFLNEWTDGIVDWTFTLEEIEKVFSDHNIKVPDPLWKDFLNVLERKKRKRNQEYYKSISRK